MAKTKARGSRRKQSRKNKHVTVTATDTLPFSDSVSRDLDTMRKPSRIGEKVNYHRLECSWTVENLADKSKITKKALIDIMKHRTNPHLSTRKQLAQAFSEELGKPITL